MAFRLDEPYRMPPSIFDQVGAAAGRQGAAADNIRRILQQRQQPQPFRPRMVPVPGQGVLRQVAPPPNPPPIQDHPKSVLKPN